jgi:tRNA pseudouridine65 synthase
MEDENLDGNHKVDSFDILYQDENFVAIQKPYGYFVHRSKLDFQANELILPQLRDQIGKKLFPVHRLDRKTTGVLLFALNPYAQITLNDSFANNKVAKEYLAIVRGYAPNEFEIDYPLVNDRGVKQEAFTIGKVLEQVEIPYESWKHPTSRYSLVLLQPQTGRQHQLRKHLSHIFHPIIGDRPHGCNKQNRFFIQHFNYNQMALHASMISFEDIDQQLITIRAPIGREFNRIMSDLGFHYK